MFSLSLSLSARSLERLSMLFVRMPLTVSGVDKYISRCSLVLHTGAVLLISSLNPVNVSGDRIQSVRVILALDNPDKLVSSAFL